VNLSLLDDFLPLDEFPKGELVRCIAVLLSDSYRDDNPLVLNRIHRGRELFNFQPPAGMTIGQERGQLALALSHEIQAHERERKAQRREFLRELQKTINAQNLVSAEIANTNDNAINEEIPIGPQENATENNENDDNNNNDNANNDNNNNEDDDNNSNNNNNENPDNAAPPPPESERIDAEEFLGLLRAQVALLSNYDGIPDNDPRISGAIVQWYTTLEIEIEPAMDVASERRRLAHLLTNLGERVREQEKESKPNKFRDKVKKFLKLTLPAFVGAVILAVFAGRRWR